ncbi:MAG: hypothetical protein JRE63_04755 [Deltaproteobacteria bacterium]|jgi:hypothetical protein|nr:hypothetical protein [Deltaproteobacteria bacterium]
MSWVIDEQFETSANKEVLFFLKKCSPSAHSDLVDEFMFAGQSASGVHFYCPDTSNYAFFAGHLADYTIVALALGMHRIVFRLPRPLVCDAIHNGGSLFPEIGREWVSFAPSLNSESEVDFRRKLGYWFRKALMTNA